MSETTTEEPMNKDERRRFFIISTALLIVAALVTGGIIWLSSRPDDKTINSNVELTAEDKAAGEKLTTDFFKTAGTWGLRENAVNADNLRTVLYTVQQNTRTADIYWLSRNQVYKSMKEMLDPSGNMWYLDSAVQLWWDDISRESLSSFKTLEVTPTIPDKGSKLTLNGGQVDSMIVQVKYSVSQTKYVATGTDSEWDGTFVVMKKVYEDEAQLILVKTGSGWKVYQITGNRYPFLLSTWETPNNDYNADQFGFTEVSRIKTKLG